MCPKGCILHRRFCETVLHLFECCIQLLPLRIIVSTFFSVYVYYKPLCTESLNQGELGCMKKEKDFREEKVQIK
jgi:hypothetical protein